MVRSISFYILVSAAFFLILIKLCRANSKTLNFEHEVINNSDSNVMCPDSSVIRPCYCYIAFQQFIIDCSFVTSDNELRQIFSQPFPSKDFSKLQIRENSDIRILSDGIFSDKTFETIEITSSSLETIEPKSLLGSATKLRWLRLEQLNLTSFPFEELPQYEALFKIILKDNKFSSFPNLKSSILDELDFSGNPIGEIPVDSFKGVPQLTQFLCSGCGIKELYSGTFTVFSNLDYLDLSYNELTYIPQEVATFNYSYSSLHLDHNQITDVAAGAFKDVDFSIIIDHNQLTELHEKVWRPIFLQGKIATFQFIIDQNPLLCGCDIAWIVEEPYFMDMMLWYPRCADGTLVTDLDPEYYFEMCGNSTSTMPPLQALN